MKNIKQTAIILLIAWAILPLPSHGQENTEKIIDYSTYITLGKDRNLKIRENIIYDFGENFRHGIFRNIPVKYSGRGGNFNLRISEITVENEIGKRYPFTIGKKDRNLEIKIGDPNIKITGKHVYIINYIVSRAINEQKQQDEIYWNAIGNEWNVPIEKASIELRVPFDALKEHMRTICFVGTYGKTDEDCSIVAKDEYTINFVSNPLGPREGLTVAAQFPKGLIQATSILQNFKYILQDNRVLSLPFLVFLLMFWLWYKRGRDPKTKNTVVAYYEAPKDLSPSEVGVIIDQKLDNRDITAEVISLAVAGYIKIHYVETEKLLGFKSKDYVLEKIAGSSQLTPPQSALLATIFSKNREKVSLSELQIDPDFHNSMEKIKSRIYADMSQKGYFVSNPQRQRNAFIALGFIIAIAGGFIFSNFGTYGIVSGIVSGLIVVFFGNAMPARTAKGAEAKFQILGLKEYLTVAEKDRLSFHNAPEKRPESFEKLLPYAIALSVEKQWARQFEGILRESPKWLESREIEVFNAYVFATSLNNFSNNFSAATTLKNNAATGKSGFGGGGFSGGGFGGGGGGSW